MSSVRKLGREIKKIPPTNSQHEIVLSLEDVEYVVQKYLRYIGDIPAIVAEVTIETQLSGNADEWGKECFDKMKITWTTEKVK